VQSSTFALLPLYIVHVIGYELIRFTQIALAMLGVNIATVLLVSKLAKWIEKRVLFNISCVLGIGIFLGFLFLPIRWDNYPETPLPPVAENSTIAPIAMPPQVTVDSSSFTIYGLGASLGIMYFPSFVPSFFLIPFSFAIQFTVTNAMTADITDLSLLKFKRRQEGLIYSTLEVARAIVQSSGLS